MNVYIVNTTEEFHKYFPLLKESAKTGSTPDTFLVGFDTEFICRDNQPESFSRAHTWLESTEFSLGVCLIQVATSSVCLVINLVKMKKPLPNNLIKIVTNSCWIKAGIGIDNDLSILSKNYNLGHCEGGLELKNLALLARVSKPNLEFLYNKMFGEYIKKGSSICDWSKDLGTEQLSYAARDAIMSYQLAETMLKPSIELISKTVSNNEYGSKLGIKLVNAALSDDDEIFTKVNYIGRLNEFAQKKIWPLPIYDDFDRPLDTNFAFKFRCTFNEQTSFGCGHSKKEAKQEAAKILYNSIL